MPMGTLVQLNSVSSKMNEIDALLIGNPEVSLFETVYMRYSNFAVNTVRSVFYTGADFGKISKCILTPENGDLISKITLNVKLPSLNITKTKKTPHKNCACKECINEKYRNDLNYGWVNSIGHALINSTWIEIGGKKIDKQYGEWMEIWSELTLPIEKRNAYYQMIGKVENSSFNVNTFQNEMDLYIPLNFWFCKNYGAALPIMCLYNQQVELVIDFRTFNMCWVKSSKKVGNPRKKKFFAQLLIDYVYLGEIEREKLYKNSHKYLIETVQCAESNNSDDYNTIVNLPFENPIKEIIWVTSRNDAKKTPTGTYKGTNYSNGNNWFNFSLTLPYHLPHTIETFDHATLKINKDYIFDKMGAKYFRLVKPFYHHTRNPTKYIYTYPFCLKPETYQPNGYMNFSNIENISLILRHQNLNKLSITTKVYGVGYNFLVIVGGMGYLLF